MPRMAEDLAPPPPDRCAQCLTAGVPLLACDDPDFRSVTGASGAKPRYERGRSMGWIECTAMVEISRLPVVTRKSGDREEGRLWLLKILRVCVVCLEDSKGISMMLMLLMSNQYRQLLSQDFIVRTYRFIFTLSFIGLLLSIMYTASLTCSPLFVVIAIVISCAHH
jgi:hypothetical protein